MNDYYPCLEICLFMLFPSMKANYIDIARLLKTK